ncbi:anti-sigma factor [Agrococcus sp. SL85]|uniref:anti-sigma factor n=1 Tax=Agrococcus sp. SL85 TaxID=2995141 RepID=UPI00226CA2AA|nr:anti-sigma factor [Agrococcus sp. SL85]WAC66452.1 anti-sigma factor [Agrococcus sp. SL85]
MQHISPERLAELALLDDAREPHLDACAACREELASLRGAVARLRADAVTAEPPPAGLWERIAAEIDEAPRAAADPAAVPAATAGTAPDREHAHVAHRGRRRARTGGIRRFTAGTLALACAATAVVVGGLSAGIAALAPREAPGTVVAAASLDALTGAVQPAAAEIVERDGRRVLVLDADALPEADGYLDVWLIDRDVSAMINVGILDADTQEYVLPDGIDLDRFPIVDVSVEPFDGDPTHSGESIWRGQLS